MFKMCIKFCSLCIIVIQYNYTEDWELFVSSLLAFYKDNLQFFAWLQVFWPKRNSFIGFFY